MLVFVAVIIGAIIHFGVGMIWYKNLGPQWAEAYGINMDEMKCEISQMVKGLGVSFLIAIGLAYIICGMGITTTFDGARAGLLAWLFFIAPIQYSGVIWGKKPVKGFLIDTGCDLIGFVLIGGFMGAIF